MKSALALCASLAAVLTASRSCADIELPCGRSTLHLSDKAVPTALLLPDGADALNHAHRGPLSEVQSPDGAWHPANAVRKNGSTLVLGFADVDTTLTLALDVQPEWLGLRIESLGGARPRAVRFVELNTAFTETVGQRLNVGWNLSHALCVMATSPQAQARAEGQTRVTLAETVAAVERGEAGVNPIVGLTAVASAKLEGASAAILACATPEFKTLAKRVAQAYGLPTSSEGAADALKHSCLRLKPSTGLPEAERIAALCKEAGLRRVLVPWDGSRTPECAALAARLRSAGLSVGVRCTATAPATEKALAELVDAAGLSFVSFEEPEKGTRGLDAYAPFQETALGLFRRPVACTGNLMTHSLGQAYARCTTSASSLEVLRGLPVRQQTDAEVAALLSLQTDMTPGELSLLAWAPHAAPGHEAAGLQLDEIEYLLSRSIAYDCPVALELEPSELERNPLSHDLLRLLSLYEQARLSGRFTEAERAEMRRPGQGFTLIQRRNFLPAFVPTRALPCGKSARARATVGPFEGGSVATFWTTSGTADVTLDLSPFVARIADFDDQRVVAKKSANERLVVPVSTRRLTVFCPTLEARALEQKIENSLCTEAARGL